MPVEYEIDIEPEPDISPEESFSEAENIAWVHAELSRGNEYAWCCVGVTARFAGFESHAGCAGCSYQDRAGLEKDLIPGLKAEALSALLAKITVEAKGASVTRAREQQARARAALRALTAAEVES